MAERAHPGRGALMRGARHRPAPRFLCIQACSPSFRADAPKLDNCLSAGYNVNQKSHDIKFFSCQNHNSGLRKCSATHCIHLDFFEQVVLYEINRLAAFANEYESDFVKAMLGRSAKVAENDRARKQRKLNALLTRDKELDMLFEQLYEDNAAGKMDDAQFARMSKRYEQEQGEIVQSSKLCVWN